MSKKLTKKKDGIGMTSLAKLLKEGDALEAKDTDLAKRSEEKEVILKVENWDKNNVKGSFNNILKNLDDKDYNCTGVIYIDEEIKEVFAMLKSKAKIKTSSLVSYVLEEFLEDNKEEINTIIKRSNRFL